MKEKEKTIFDDEIPDIEEIKAPNFVDANVNLDENKTTYSSKIEEIEQKFSEDRSLWTKRVLWCSQNLKDIKKNAIVSVKVYSYRQILIEARHKLFFTWNKLQHKLKIKKKEAFEKSKLDYEHRLSQSKDKEIFILAYTADIQEMSDLLQSQINFLTDTIKSFSDLTFGLKNRIELEKFLIGEK